MGNKKNIFKQVIAVTSGTILQWYDFSLFGYLTPIIAELYFPDKNRTSSFLYAFGLFAVSFLLAPLGAAVFGYIADNSGRKKALMLTILLMAIPTAMIGVLPTYFQIGILAPILLTLCRLMQGFVASAEFAGSAVYLVEQANKQRSYLLGSLTSSSYSIGLLLGSVVVMVVTMNGMPSYAWRIPFLLALIAQVLIFYIRNNISETNTFQFNQPANRKTKTWFMTALKDKPQAVIVTLLIAWFVGIITFGTYVFSVSYLTEYIHVDLSVAVTIVSLALLLDACVEPFIAIIADKIGGIKISVIGMLGFLIFSYLLFKLMVTGNMTLIVFAMLSLSLLIAVTYAPMNTLLVNLFPAEYRASGFGVSFNLGIAIFGGTAPIVLTSLIYWTGNLLAPAMYYIAGSVIGLFAIQLMCSMAPKSQFVYQSNSLS